MSDIHKVLHPNKWLKYPFFDRKEIIMSNALEVVRDQFAKASRFADVFGSLTGVDIEAKKRVLKKQYAVLAKMTHPDRVSAPEVALATAVFAELSTLYRRAQDALVAGVYDNSFIPSRGGAASTKVTVSAGTATYQLDVEAYREGDFSNIHLGEAADGSKIFAKIAADPTLNPYLVGEANLLAQASKSAALKGILPFLPKLLDSVILTEVGNEQFRVNLYEYKPGFVSLTEIKNAFPGGLPPEDAAWIFRRVLGQTLAANMLGVVHGAIVPDHVLVNPLTHEPLHIGWAHAIERPAERNAKLTTVIDRWRDWYPLEVLAREVPSHQTDLYMAGKTMVYLLGGDVARDRFPSHVPEPLVQLVRRCLETKVEKRPRDAFALMQEFTKVIDKLWGRKYRPLRLP